MISEFENLSLGGNNTASNHADPFTHTELTPEQQKTLIEIRRRKTELLLEIQVSVYLSRCQSEATFTTVCQSVRARSLAGSVHSLGVMFIKAGPGTGEEERRGSVSNWFSSLRRGGRRRREDTTVPSGYGSLGRRKDGTQARGKTRSAWDLTTVTRMVCIYLLSLSLGVFAYCNVLWRFSLGTYPNALVG
ncbi:hypothetical protein RR48_10421 [Papilio machaon]|uniref:Uncharacterized protein n=1 Tax=Papilio machaon TaxID=76193 RepID=A0A194RAA4_PAPMA|nr:hypothetical protein RR48_10421 [Papilio machaon]